MSIRYSLLQIIQITALRTDEGDQVWRKAVETAELAGFELGDPHKFGTNNIIDGSRRVEPMTLNWVETPRGAYYVAESPMGKWFIKKPERGEHTNFFVISPYDEQFGFVSTLEKAQEIAQQRFHDAVMACLSLAQTFTPVMAPDVETGKTRFVVEEPYMQSIVGDNGKGPDEAVREYYQGGHQ